MRSLLLSLAVAGLSLRLAAECSLILTAADLSGDLDWPQIAHDAGIDVLATHVGPKDVIPFLKSARGRKFLADCRRYGIGVEHELHALEYLLPRALFASEPELFRMDDKGNRQNDANCCPSHPRALAIIASNAVEVARVCRPTTHRYYFWMTDDKPVCFCPKCRQLSASDQAVLIENAIVRALRAQLDPEARLSHLAYLATLEAPRKVRPDSALFLEFAPIRRWSGVTKREDLSEDGIYAKYLGENLTQFPPETAKALEYWLDESLFCNWSNDRVEIPWNEQRTREDIGFYRRRGISSFSTFAVKIDGAYVEKYGESFRDHIRSFATLTRGRNPMLESGFRDPPKAASPHVWYHLMNGHVTKAGITRDFEALAAAGIGGVQMFDAGCGIDAGPMAFASDAWFDMMAHAFREAERLGLEVVVANCSGWSTAGGPWIAPSNSMKRLVFTKSDVLTGNSHFSGILPVPPDTNDFYEDIAVLAVPEPLTHELPRPVRTSDGNAIILDFGREVTARGFSYRVETGEPWSLDGEIVAEPGGRYPITVARSGVTDGGFRYRAFRKPATARRFRFSLELAEPTTAHNPPDTVVRLSDVRLEGDVKIDELAAKTFAYRMDVSPTPAESDHPVPVSSVIDLTGRMSIDGKLDWSVPPGRWRLLRFGFASNGKKCHPASKTGEGLEVDKLDPEAVALHFASYVGRLAAIGSPAFKGILVDSYEAGAQNWTRGLELLFRERKGYDLRPWLPVFAGYVVESVAASERTLTDFRQVVSDRFARSFAGTLQRQCHDAGLRLNLEPYGNAGVRNLDYGAFADVPMSEFWLHDDRRFEDGGNGRIAASLAHVMGFPIAAAEAFTSAPEKTHGRWLDTPWRMKSAGDRAYAIGVNRIVYHRFTHQPDADES